jgi:hypothetical protein
MKKASSNEAFYLARQLKFLPHQVTTPNILITFIILLTHSQHIREFRIFY